MLLLCIIESFEFYLDMPIYKVTSRRFEITRNTCSLPLLQSFLFFFFFFFVKKFGAQDCSLQELFAVQMSITSKCYKFEQKLNTQILQGIFVLKTEVRVYHKKNSQAQKKIKRIMRGNLTNTSSYMYVGIVIAYQYVF